ncbi:MAG: hypothetical protein AB1563_12470, partial [Bacillota bacterium]
AREEAARESRESREERVGKGHRGPYKGDRQAAETFGGKVALGGPLGGLALETSCNKPPSFVTERVMRVIHDAGDESRSDARVKKTLEMLHALEDKLSRGLGVTRSKRLYTLCDDLADLALEGERMAETIRAILASGDTADSLAEAFGDLEAQSFHIAWHVRSLRRNLEWVHRLLDSKGRYNG